MTSFKKEFHVGDSIRFMPVGEKTAIQIMDQIIESIDSDTSLSLKEPGVVEFKSTQQYKFKILPKIDQSQTFKHVINFLGDGGALGIFPEGGSHDQTDILPFKAGIAFMSLQTTLNHKVPVTIIPCGLKYFNSHKFRSKVILEFGRPYQATQDMLNLF